MAVSAGQMLQEATAAQAAVAKATRAIAEPVVKASTQDPPTLTQQGKVTTAEPVAVAVITEVVAAVQVERVQQRLPLLVLVVSELSLVLLA